MSSSLDHKFFEMVTNPEIVGDDWAADGERAELIAEVAQDKDIVFVAGNYASKRLLGIDMLNWCGLMCVEVRRKFGLTKEEMEQVLRTSQATLLGREDGI